MKIRQGMIVTVWSGEVALISGEFETVHLNFRSDKPVRRQFLGAHTFNFFLGTIQVLFGSRSTLFPRGLYHRSSKVDE